MEGPSRREALNGESGVALGLAILVVVVAGVIGAGLLVFARGDLASVIQANRGQSAFYAADAGAEMAKRELLGDASPASYDADGSDGSCDSPLDEDGPVASEWSSERGGATRTFEGEEFTAEVRWLAVGCGFPSGGDPDTDYFQVVSTGVSGEAKRRVQAIYAVSDTGAPLANYAAGNVNVAGGAALDGVSVFSGGDVQVGDSGSFRGSDLVYGRWKTGGAERPVSAAGAGAVGSISGDVSRVGSRDFDGGSEPRFVGESSGNAELTFPFDPKHWQGPALDLLEEESKAQGSYRISGGSLSWPEDSSESTVVYAKFEGLPGNVTLTPASCGEPGDCRGVLVVENGSVVVQSGARFEGAVVAAGGDRPEALSVVVVEDAVLTGFASSSGTLDLRGTLRGLERREALRLPGFHSLEVWSWRELYE